MILMNDFTAEAPELRDSMLRAAQRVIESGWYVLGKEGISFENKWADACGVMHGVGVGNGMDAIEIILRSLNIGMGDEVITTPMTAFATVLAILRCGAIPVLADIEPDTGLLSLTSAQRCLSNRTKAIVLVHLYGQMRNMLQWQRFCKESKIHLIEDCAQSHLASSQGKFAGSFGAAGAYSFYPTKNLGAIGDAGMVITNDPIISNRAIQLRNYGQSLRYQHPELGMNSRLDELQAAILMERIKWLPEFTERRRKIAYLYHEGIKNPLVKVLALPQEETSHVYHLYVVICNDRDALQNHLKDSDIQALIHYPICIHHQESCLDVKRDPAGLGISEQHAETCLSLPCHPQMSDSDVEKVVAAVNRYK